MLKLRLSSFASVKLTIAIFAAILVTILLGAWCPQESAGGFDKVVETFGAPMALKLRDFGITDIFHTPFFLGLIGLLTVNMIACSVQRVFPKVRLLKQALPFLSDREISKFPVNSSVQLKGSATEVFAVIKAKLRKQGYTVKTSGEKLTGEWGKVGRLAATVTHIGLLSLLAGVTITSWTGFTGFKPVPLGTTMSFDDSEHSKQWLGTLPKWKVKVDATRREDYESGDAKQWYSTLSVVDTAGKVLKTQEISVNNPLSYDGVDIYQSSWALDSILVYFNKQAMKLRLQQMGGTQAAFVPLDEKTILIFSLRKQDAPVRVFGKIPEWEQPRLLAEIPQGSTASFGAVPIRYQGPVPITGLQYKSDPGLPVTYVAFSIIMMGVMMAAIPHRQVWVYVQATEEGASAVYLGGVSRKAKRAFERSIATMVEKLKVEFGDNAALDSLDSASVLVTGTEITAEGEGELSLSAKST